MTPKRGWVVIAAAVTTGAALLFVFGVGHDAFVGEISVTLGRRIYATSAVPVVLGVFIMVAAIGVAIAIRRSKKLGS